MSDTQQENITDMQEDNKVKSFIVSINGEGLTCDILMRHSVDLPKLDAVMEIIKQQCIINDIQINSPILNKPI